MTTRPWPLICAASWGPSPPTTACPRRGRTKSRIRYNQYEQGKGDLGKDEFRATVHDPSQPPLTTYAELLRVMAENGVKSVSLDQDVWQSDVGILKYPLDRLRRKTLFAPQGATRVDIALPTEFKTHAQTHEHDATYHRRNPYPTHYFVEHITSVKGARPGSALLSGERLIEFKIDTNIENERTAPGGRHPLRQLRPG